MCLMNLVNIRKYKIFTRSVKLTSFHCIMDNSRGMWTRVDITPILWTSVDKNGTRVDREVSFYSRRAAQYI